MTARRVAVAVALCIMAAVVPRSAAAAPGKFYIVGMGSAPDLVTLRALDVVKRADVIILEEDGERQQWKDLIGRREVWLAPKYLRVFLGVDERTLTKPDLRSLAAETARGRNELVARIRRAVDAGKIVAALQGGDAMIYGTTFYLELLPKDFPSEIVPGVGSFQAAAAAVKMSPVYGWDSSSVILTMADWPGRADVNEKLMALKTSMAFYTMHLDYPALFAQLARHYPGETPVAVVSYAGDPVRQQVVRSTVGGFLKEVRHQALPAELHLLFVGKFLTVGQARKDGVLGGTKWIMKMHGRGGRR